jgi:hypothetical protein
VKAATNVTNMSSPVNPVSPVNSAIQPMELPVQQPVEAQSSLETMSSSQTQETSATPSATSATQPSATTSSETTPTIPQVSAPKGKELVPGFGLVMSLDLLNGPIIQQEQTLNTLLEYQQELPYELRGNQGILLEFIDDSEATAYFNNRGRWESNLLNGYVFQRLQGFD